MPSTTSTLATSPSRSEELRRLREIFNTLYAENPTQTLQDVTAMLQEAHVDVFVDDIAGNAYLGRTARDDILLPPNKFSYTEIEFGQQQQRQQLVALPRKIYPNNNNSNRVKAEQLLNTTGLNVLDTIKACFRPVFLKQPILTLYKNLYCYYQSNIYNLLAHMRGGNNAFVTMVKAGFPEGTFMADVRRGDAAGVMLDIFGPVFFLAVETQG
ncbi:hypothetical protein [Parasitella parasitica]|uniref:Uncharacterized protein n=1 Tax=Parasitella parasitica TaxID=35722 RepID=A0A0B7NGQ5_9FUNG|nr:hypothetical protein [Parasitella parasitica]